MTTEALDIFKTHKDEQLGEDGIFTKSAIYDPDIQSITIYGLFDNVKFRENKGSGNVEQKKSGPRFVVSEFNIDIDIYENVELRLPHINKTFIIDEIERDETGAQILWLL